MTKSKSNICSNLWYNNGMKKQEEILNFINQKIEKEGYSPSVREIASAVGLKSTSSVQHHINNLVSKGLLNKKPNISRSFVNNSPINNVKLVPIIGAISAGTPLMAEENHIGTIPMPEEKFNKNLFALRVSGDSMIDAGIYNGDTVVINKEIEPKDGDIGAFMVNENEATIKFLDTISGKKYLIPANKNYENILVNDFIQPVGKVVSLFRDI